MEFSPKIINNIEKHGHNNVTIENSEITEVFHSDGHPNKDIEREESPAAEKQPTEEVSEREQPSHTPDLEIKLPIDKEHQKQEGEKKLSREVMLEKSQICKSLREDAHKTLEIAGDVDSSFRGEEMQKLQTGFDKRVMDVMGKLETVRDISLTGPFMPVLMGLFSDYWKDQGLANKIKLFGKTKTLEGLFIIRSLSNRIEELVSKMDESDSAEEVKFYNNQIKKYLRVYVDWQNEFRKLNLIRNEKADSVYGSLNKTTESLDRIIISEIYAEGESGNEELDNRNLDKETNLKKNEICAGLLNLAKESPAPEAVYVRIKNNITNHLLKIQKSKTKGDIFSEVEQLRDYISGVPGALSTEILKKLLDIEKML